MLKLDGSCLQLRNLEDLQNDPTENEEERAGLAELANGCKEHLQETAVYMKNLRPHHPLTLEAFGTVSALADAIAPEDTDPM